MVSSLSEKNKKKKKKMMMQNKNLITQLAVAVRSVQWSYGIFWAPSTTQQGVLEWRDGYYNGDIKTRKTVKTMEINKADKVGLQRSEQLNELYMFLQDPQTKRPSAALTPDDLSDSEWYYLVCMSFVFFPNQSLPGRSLETGETIWLCNAQHADSKVFSRSLLAKSASIQTVVCFPYSEGVIEIGTTELVEEDPNLIQHVKACFLEFSKPVCSDKSSSALNKPDDDKYPAYAIGGGQGMLDALALENSCSPAEEIKLDQDPVKELQDDDNNEDSYMDSPDGCSNGCDEHRCRVGESMIEGIDNGAPDSLSSCDCISEASTKIVSEIQPSGIQDEDFNYTRTLRAILGDSSVFKKNPDAGDSNCKSSFVEWKKGGVSERKRPRPEQSMLKKTLFSVPLMHRNFSSHNSQKEHDTKEWTSRLGNVSPAVPHSIREVEKISILGDTIKYLKELEARVGELECHMEFGASEARTRRKCDDVLEQISDNYGARKAYKGMKKPWMSKRKKACDIDEKETETEEAKTLDVKVKMKEEEVLIEVKCPYREYILHDIMDAINNLHLDAHTVESSTIEGVLTLTLKSKFRGAATAPPAPGMIREALWKVSGNI